MVSQAVKTSLWTALLLSSAMAQRTVISLCGTWDLAVTTGTSTTIPTAWTHTIPVPGYQNLSSPLVSSGDNWWYRKILTISGAVPAVAQLKIFKAQYGTDVWLDGTYIGAHAPCHTPGYFDLTSKLRGNGAPDTLVVKVHSYATMPDSVIRGNDYEKAAYIAGIYDSVEVILSGAPYITNIKTAPDLANAKVRVYATLSRAASSTAVPVRGYVYEAVSGTLVGSAQIASMTVPAGRDTTAVLDIAIPNFKPWSPESPFLYHLAIGTGTDSADTRLGMRTITTGLTAMGNKLFLNGQPYMLLGTNMCFRRFENDALRASLPFDENWARTVIRKFKSVNWTSARFSIGFPSEMWYRICDEEGFLVQDEFPIWQNCDWAPGPVSQPELTTEFKEWIDERQNHPCMYCWDACNETVWSIADAVGNSLQSSSYDPQNRPWNFGREGNTGMCNNAHPSFETLAERHDYSQGGDQPNNLTKVNWNFTATKQTPVVINESSGMFLTRTGGPATSSSSDANLAKYTTPDGRRYIKYMLIAAGTQRLRMGFDWAGTQHFCGLANQGYTGDEFLPTLSTPDFSTQFYQFMPGAFSPLMVGINTFFATRTTGSTEQVEVVLINDTYQSWSGPVTLQLQQQGCSITWNQSQNVTVAALSKTSVTFSVTYPSSATICRLQADIVWNNKHVRSVRDICIGTAVTIQATDFCDLYADSGQVVQNAYTAPAASPKSFELVAASPNPFTQTTQIQFRVPFDSKVSIELCDISGRVVKTLVNGATEAGYHTVSFDGCADNNRVLANGYYFCRMTANGFDKTVKLVKVK